MPVDASVPPGPTLPLPKKAPNLSSLLRQGTAVAHTSFSSPPVCVSRRVTMLLSVGCSTENRKTASHAAIVTYIQGDPLKGVTQQARIWKVFCSFLALLYEVAKSESARVLFPMLAKEDSAIADYETATFTTKYKTEKKKSRSCNSIPLPYPHVPLFLFHFSLATPTSLLFSSHWQCLQHSLCLAALYLKHVGSTRDGKLMREVQHLLMKWHWEL